MRSSCKFLEYSHRICKKEVRLEKAGEAHGRERGEDGSSSEALGKVKEEEGEYTFQMMAFEGRRKLRYV